jgi:hypothetical protein
VRHGMPFVMSQGALGPLVSDNGLNSLMLFENGITFRGKNDYGVV